MSAWCLDNHATVYQMDDRHSGLWYWRELGTTERRGPWRTEAACRFDCKLSLMPFGATLVRSTLE